MKKPKPKVLRMGSIEIIRMRDGHYINIVNHTPFPVTVTPTNPTESGIGFGIFVDTTPHAKAT